MSHAAQDYVCFGISGLGGSGRFWGLDKFSRGNRRSNSRSRKSGLVVRWRYIANNYDSGSTTIARNRQNRSIPTPTLWSLVFEGRTAQLTAMSSLAPLVPSNLTIRTRKRNANSGGRQRGEKLNR